MCKEAWQKGISSSGYIKIVKLQNYLVIKSMDDTFLVDPVIL